MKLKIITPESGKTEHEIVWIEAHTLDGNFVIQKNHCPTTLLLESGKELNYCFITGKEESLPLKHGGILEITRKEAIVLVIP